MIQSITFGDKNTWDDWKILPTERPVFAPPKQKTTLIDIPGGNGSLDLSEALTGYPVYNNRTGSFKFRVMNGYKPWNERYSEIMNYLHGKSMTAVLFDEPDYLYRGRFSVDDWKSEDTWSIITIGYSVDPYKWSLESSTEPWKWDPFNFENGIIRDSIFSGIYISSSSSWTSKSFNAGYFGIAPFSPNVTISGASSTGIDIRFINSYLGIDVTMNFKNGTTFVPDMIFYGQTTPYTILFKGIGTVSIDFRVGRL